ncbi:leucyl/phenylalanyl-tRNA--protein transferase [Novimethylophilus kurashikiensis]|uniref:Leucyl/phenylalanyl-tRNA--protein transferase n=2 Tax=Novimethylophilus kurashikiensis TaxID=1825523 RepID=A0A2R5F298_9PROT|nr:leucyl/phenylalanyl-tRNA--protein transferase [Novimethylophilus kurashikiensis]
MFRNYIPWLEPESSFPPLENAMLEPNGLLAAGGDLSPQRLLEAYRRGIFPWYSRGQPILWWSPDPRMVVFPEELKVSKSLAKRLKKGDFEVRTDSAFREVMLACGSAPRDGQHGTWIVPEIVEAYCKLHELGYAHSVETWMDGELVGGLYGVAVGKMFYGESMFHKATDASKIAFVHLVRWLHKQDFGMIDCQMHTPHLESLGGREIPRHEFEEILRRLINYPHSTRKWKLHDAAQ